MAGWRSRRKWPPSPFVEDEDDSLAHELSTSSSTTSKSDDEAPVRGSVDQYPIILDVNLPDREEEAKNDSASTDRASLSSRSSDESLGPATPSSSTSDRPRRTQFSANVPTPLRTDRQSPLTTSDDTKQDGARQSRGRSNVSRINTNLDGDVQYMLSGQRRAPSPYRYVKPEQQEVPKGQRFSGDSFLAPNAGTSRQTPLDTSDRRATSTRPTRERKVDFSSSEESDRRRRHHSRRRSTRESFSVFPTDEEDKLGRVYRQSSSQSTSNVSGLLSAEPKDERYRSRQDDHSDSDRRWSRHDTPYTSSAEESRPRIRERSRRRDRSTRRSERPSVINLPRPQVGILSSSAAAVLSPSIEQRYDGRRHQHDSHVSRHDYDSERSFHRGATSIYTHSDASEQDWERALKDNHSKRVQTPMPSPKPSPRSSPPTTPPRTPRSNKAPADYFNSVAPGIPPQGGPSRSNVPSRAGTLNDQKMPPPGPPRTVTLDEGRSPSVLRANGSMASPALPRSPRLSTDSYPFSSVTTPAAEARQRPYSNASPLADTRSLPRTMSYSTAAGEFPRVVQRASSYSSTDHLARDHPALNRHSQVYTISTSPSGRPTMYSAPSSQDQVPRIPPFDPSSIELPTCPNSESSVGHTDWCMLSAVPNLHFCRSCMGVLGKSRFSHLFVRSPPEIAREPTICAMSRPWIRLAWIQTMKQRRPDLKLLGELDEVHKKTKHCPGKTIQSRPWYFLYDPEKDNTVPDFSACSECVRSIIIIWPQFDERHDFVRPHRELQQEKFCHLDGNSRRFPQYMALLEAAANEYDTKRRQRPDMSEFRHFARKASRYRECQRSDQLMGEVWHFIPQLPEFTICEECFHQVVWPVRDQPIANMVIRSLQPPPGTDRHTRISCQLYSERMRRLFHDAIHSRDFNHLQQVTLRRHKFEILLTKKKDMILRDHEKGIDRTNELGKLIAQWKEFE